MSTTRSQARRFKVGDWVSFTYGIRTVWAQIIEDRGPIGVNRRRLYRIQFDNEESEPVAFDVSENDLHPVELDRAAVVEYLQHGGLVEILRSNLGGRDQPKVWLTVNSHGNPIHTFDQDKGLIGGETVPFFALQGDRIFSPKTRDVVQYLSTFGLSRSEAEAVVKTVGTAP